MPMTKPTFAWEPFTPRGVAAFARARLADLLLAQFRRRAARRRIRRLVSRRQRFSRHHRRDSQRCPTPAKSAPRNWTGAAIRRCCSPRAGFSRFDVDSDHGGKINSTADVQIEFGQDNVWLRLAVRLHGISLSARPNHRLQPHRRWNRSGARGARSFCSPPPC